jgi:hypothetical protein
MENHRTDLFAAYAGLRSNPWDVQRADLCWHPISLVLMLIGAILTVAYVVTAAPPQ